MATAKHPVERYIRRLAQGKIVACRWVRLACERHLRDLRTGRRRGLVFDREAASHAIEFFSFLSHSKGEWAGQPVRLELWEQAIVWILFGWMRRKTGTRRFNQAYIEIARKNGKSLLASGIALYMLIGDGEPGAEVYSAATKRDQAKIVWDEAARMVRKSPQLREFITVHKDRMFLPFDTASKYEPVGRDADTMDGLNVHCAIADELHAHRTSEVWDVLETGMGARRQPLLLAITTAGFNQASFCYSMRKYATAVLDQVIQNDAFFTMIFTLDEDDDPWDERNWIKANPNLGVSVYLPELRNLAAKAKELPSSLNSFLVKRLNIWTTSAEHWIHPDRWRACAGSVDEAALVGRVCYGGLDLSSTQDLTALVWVFPPTWDDPLYRVLCRFWAPESAIQERSRSQRVPYDVWMRNGLITPIPGEVIDYAYIYEQIEQDVARFQVREIGYDRYQAAEIYVRLANAGLTMVQIAQTTGGMNGGMRVLEHLIAGRLLAHGDHAVLTWNIHNVVVYQDSNGNIKPDKRKSTEKIDGAVALVMALGRATLHDAAASSSMYDDPGIVAA
jgi:phage terminase large subunit-like protein